MPKSDQQNEKPTIPLGRSFWPLSDDEKREIDLLYGKLAAASPLTDAELRSAFASALERLAQHEMDTAEERVMRRTP